MTGRANTALNLIVFSSAFAVQWAFGAVVGLWPVVRALSPTAAFVLPLVLEVVAFAWLMVAPEHSNPPLR